MDGRAVDKIVAATEYPRRFASIALLMLAAFLLAATIGELKSIQFIGSGVTATNTISVSGHGEAFAVPDTAQFSTTIMESASDVSTAQNKTDTEANTIIAYLKGAGVDATDIQTTDYNIDPQYQYSSSVCPQPAIESGSGGAASGVYCPPGKQVLTGYQVSETLTVKVHDTSKAGTLLSGVGSKGASSVSGLTFTIADPDTVDAQARDKAIADAKTKAQALAQSLGVSLVRIVGFSENGNAPVPYALNAMAVTSAGSPASVAPEIATGQNEITSDVSLTYEIQ